MRNYSMRKNKIIIMVFVTILIILTFLIISINFGSVSAETLNDNEIDAISESMTSSIIFNVKGEQKSLIDYPSYLHNRFKFDNKNYEDLNVEDEWIKNIVPEELFKQKIEDYFYIGDEYGFYFNSNDDGTYLIYLIKHNYDYYSGNLKRTIKPIYYENYVYNEATGIVSLEYIQYEELCASCKPCYFPSEHNIPRYHYNKYSIYNKLYLKDVNFTANLYNENHLNVGEYGYDANVDNGGYFIGNRYYFNGVSTQSGKGEFLVETLKIGLGYIPLGNSGLTLGDAMSIGTFISEYVNFIDAAKNDFRSKISNVDLTKYVDIEEVLYAKDQIEKGGLFKSSGTQIVTSNKIDAVLYGLNNDNYVTSIFSIMHQTQSTKWNTRFSGKISLDIVKEVPDGFGSKVVNIASVESNDWNYSIDNGYSTEIELYEPTEEIYILKDAKHKVKFTAPENGLYTIRTYGDVKNSLKSTKGEISDTDINNKKLAVDLKKGEVFFCDVTKNNSEGSDFIGIAVEYTPQEIVKGERQTITIAPGEKEYFTYDSKAIGFDYCFNSIDTIEVGVAQTTYYNTFYRHSGNRIYGSVVKNTGKYYISITNNSTISQIVELTVNGIEELNIDNVNEVNIIYQKAIIIEIPYTMDVSLTAEFENVKYIDVLNNNGDIIAKSRGDSVKNLFFKMLSNQPYYILISSLSNTREKVVLSFEKHISTLLPNYNYFNNVYKDGIMLYNNQIHSGEYFIASDVNFLIYDNQYNLLNANNDGSYTLLKSNNYYFYSKEDKQQCNIDFQ